MAYAYFLHARQNSSGVKPAGWRIASATKERAAMLTRQEKRRLRAARHYAELLTNGVGIPHKVKSDNNGYFYPIAQSAYSSIRNHTKTASGVYQKTITQKIIIRGNLKRKRNIRYTRLTYGKLRNNS